jgi:hypothetical protein
MTLSPPFLMMHRLENTPVVKYIIFGGGTLLEGPCFFEKIKAGLKTQKVGKHCCGFNTFNL